MDIGPVGIWSFQLDLQPMARAQELAAELEELGYGAIWIPEAVSREAVSNSALLLAATQRVAVCTGIASIWARDAMAMAQAHKTLTEAFPDRFLLGLGVSHQPMVEGLRHQNYDRPYSAMKAYLDAMDAAPFFGVPPTAEPQRVLAALGPKMLALSAERARGAHPYFVPVEHTAEAREILGPDPILAPEQMVVLETDRQRALDIARKGMAVYLRAPNYVNNLKRLGFTDDDVADGGSEKLADAIVASGTVENALDRVDAHFAAGASHVCVQ